MKSSSVVPASPISSSRSAGMDVHSGSGPLARRAVAVHPVQDRAARSRAPSARPLTQTVLVVPSSRMTFRR